MDSINLIENPRFEDGTRKPEDWKWVGGKSAEWQWATNGSAKKRIMEITGEGSPEFCGWTQRFECEGNEYYRIDINLTVEQGEKTIGEHEGVTILLQGLKGTKKIGTAMRMPAPNSGTSTVRAYFHTPKDATNVDVHVGLTHSDATLRIHEAIAVPVLEPETKGHPVAIPQPPYEYPFPKRVETICVVSDMQDRTITRILKQRLGESNVTVVAPGEFKPNMADTVDAILVPDATPLSSMKTLNNVLKLAKDTLLILSLKAFEPVASKSLKVRTIRSKDDPLYATVRFSNFITRGFALRDCFPYYFSDSNPRFFRQSHFKKGKEFKAWVEKNEFDVILHTETDADTTSDMPMGLYRGTENGGVVVLDTTPVEAIDSSADEATLAAWILFNILGFEQYMWGQFTSPARTHREFWDDFFELDKHFPELTIHGVDHPYRPEHNPLIELAGDPGIHTLPVEQRPTILVRTGLTGCDFSAQYGVMNWLKNIVRPWPFTSPYLSPLSGHCRMAWTPSVINYSDFGGTGIYTQELPECECVADFEEGAVTLLVDFVTDTTLSPNQYEISLSGDPEYAERLKLNVEKIIPALLDGRYFSKTVEPGIRCDHVETRGWREFKPEFLFNTSLSTDDSFHASAISAGATVVCIRIPDNPGNIISHSIQRTDVVSTLVEQIIGTNVGILATNRYGKDIELPVPEELVKDIEEMYVLRQSETPGEVDGEAPKFRKGMLTLCPGEAICGLM